jgi:hypothetical protein
MKSLAEITVRNLEGDPLRLGAVIDRPTIVVIPRYYGCLPCRDYLRQVSERYADIQAAGGTALGVSVGADYQARWLIEQHGIRFPLLIDPERHLYDAIDLPRRWWVTVNPRSWWNYARAIARKNRQGRIIELNQLPGLVLLDAEARPTWIHRGRAIGDYPKLDTVLAKLTELPDSPPSGSEQAGPPAPRRPGGSSGSAP